jgi:hypothetical protein
VRWKVDISYYLVNLQWEPFKKVQKWLQNLKVLLPAFQAAHSIRPNKPPYTGSLKLPFKITQLADNYKVKTHAEFLPLRIEIYVLLYL